ncbi:MAG: hypothetical protein DHS20C16_23470 [Phycisphaerae bacterium]|nr:MAG: hypothetical protein DHS20C16_23470 [Phycisphaerae bacterium]
MARRFLLTILIMMTGLTLVSWGISFTYLSYNSHNYIWRLNNGTFSRQLRAGSRERTGIIWYGYDVARMNARQYGYHLLPRGKVKGALYPRYILPLWIPAVVFGGLAMLVYAPIRRQRKRQKMGWCTHCGYDLTGNESRVCPECGTNT